MPMTHEVLVLEDDQDLRHLLCTALESPNRQVRGVATLNQAKQEIKQHRYSLLIIDIGLPDGDGLEFFATMRAEPGNQTMSVIFLTGRHELGAKVQAFSLGAEDYLVKPVALAEIQARVESKLRRLTVQSSASGTTSTVEKFARGPLRVDMVSQRAFLKDTVGAGEKELPLTFSEFKLLNFLARSEDLPVTREQLIESVWGADAGILPRTVDKHISTLRQKLASVGHEDLILTVARSGYRFRG